MSVSDWTRLRIGNWWIGGGSGWTEAYDGNADAAQLWIDLHSGDQHLTSYDPTASNVRLEARWYGVGRSFPLRIGSGEATIELTVRRITAGEYIDRTVIGSVDGEDFA